MSTLLFVCLYKTIALVYVYQIVLATMLLRSNKMGLTRLFIYVYAGGLVPVLPNVFFKGSLQRTTWQKAEFSPSLLFSHGPTQSAFRPIRLTKIVFNLYTDLISFQTARERKSANHKICWFFTTDTMLVWFDLVHDFFQKICCSAHARISLQRAFNWCSCISETI